MLIYTPGNKSNNKYSFTIPSGKKHKNGAYKLGDTVKIHTIKGTDSLTGVVSKKGKEMIIRVGY